MKLAIILFETMTSLDFIGFYDGVTRLKSMGFIDNLSWDICAYDEQVSDDRGVTYKIPCVRPNLAGYDLIYVPGGMGTRTLIHDTAFIAWLQTAKDVPYKVAVCTGSLLLGAAGFLKGKRRRRIRMRWSCLPHTRSKWKQSGLSEMAIPSQAEASPPP